MFKLIGIKAVFTLVIILFKVITNIQISITLSCPFPSRFVPENVTLNLPLSLVQDVGFEMIQPPSCKQDEL